MDWALKLAPILETIHMAFGMSMTHRLLAAAVLAAGLALLLRWALA